MPEHVNITDPNIHEIKGASTAAVNTVPVATGAGSHTWSKIGSSSIDTASIFNTNKFALSASFPDVSTADTIIIPIPFACTLTRATTALSAAITIADSTLTLTNSTGPSTIGTITIAFTGSAEGTIDQLTPGANNSFTAGTYLKIATDGASTTTAKLFIFLEFTRTA